jgi:hypothetical protein
MARQNKFAVHMKRKRPAGFCNVDLDIVSRQRLDAVAEELGKSLLVLHHGNGLGVVLSAAENPCPSMNVIAIVCKMRIIRTWKPH